MYTHHQYQPRIFFAPEVEAPPAAPSAEGVSMFDGFTIAKDDLSSTTVTGDELKGEVKKDPPQQPPPAPTSKVVLPTEGREKGPGHAQFKTVTEARDKAIKDLEEQTKAWAAKEADYQSKLGKTEVPEEFKTQLAESIAARTRLEKDLQGLIATRAAQAEFEPRKNAALEKIGIIGATRGDQAMITAAKNGNYEALAEIVESGELTPLQKRDVDRLLNEARGYDEQLSQRTSNPDEAWKQLEERNKAEMQMRQQAVLANNLELANRTHAELVKTLPALADAPELAKEIKSRLVALAGGEGNEKYTAKQIMAVVSEHAIFETLCKSQQTKLTKLEADLKEKTAALDRLKSPNFKGEYLEPELEDDTVGTGAFAKGGLVVNAMGAR